MSLEINHDLAMLSFINKEDKFGHQRATIRVVHGLLLNILDPKNSLKYYSSKQVITWVSFPVKDVRQYINERISFLQDSLICLSFIGIYPRIL